MANLNPQAFDHLRGMVSSQSLTVVEGEIFIAGLSVFDLILSWLFLG